MKLIQIKTLDAVTAEAWDRYVDAHADGIWHHRSGWLEYCASRIDGCDNLSFAVYQNERIIGLAAITVEPDGGWHMGGGPLPRPIADDAFALALVKAELHRLSELYGPPKWLVEGDGAELPDPYSWHDCGWKMRSITGSAHWKNVRHSYRSIIHRGEADYTMRLGQNVNELHRIHAIEAGRETRSPITWALMQLWIAERHAFIVEAFDEDEQEVVGAVYIYLYKGIAYYGHAATLRRDVNHVLLWWAIRHAFAIGGTRFDVGWIGHAANKKESNIEFFRHGFGGLDHDWPVVEAVVGSAS